MISIYILKKANFRELYLLRPRFSADPSFVIPGFQNGASSTTLAPP